MTIADVDHVLLQLGQFGRFQVLNYVALSFPIFFSALFTLTYVFTASDLDYRCRIAECEPDTKGEFLPPWIHDAVPFHDRKPSSCERYAIKAPSGTDDPDRPQFDPEKLIRCTEFVYKPDQMNSVAREWNITCDERWQLTLPGTVNNIGLFFGLPFAGFISDRFGRKRLLIWSWFLTCCMGFIRSFATNISFLATFEFFDAFFGAGVFSACFILGLELVGPDKRVLGSTVLSLVYSFGQVFLGIYAMLLRDWKSVLHAIYVPAFLCLILLWPAPESVRWLASKGRLYEADNIIRRAAKFNKVIITDVLEDRTNLVEKSNKNDETTEKLRKKEKEAGFTDVETTQTKKPGGILVALKSPTIFLRFLNCAFNWAANTFVYYGLSLNSVVVEGNVFINFILVSFIEMPAIFVQMWMLERYGRRTSLCSSLLLAGVACICFLFIPPDMMAVRLIAFLSGKFGVTISFAVLYMFTAELFPTNVRHSFVGACSMFGRVGSMLAPQTPLLGRYMESLPLMLFGIVSIIAGLLSLLFPETKDKSLPDSIEAAEKMG